MYIPKLTPRELSLFGDNRHQRAVQINKQVSVRYIFGHLQIVASAYVTIRDQVAQARQMIKQRNRCLGFYKPSGILICKIEPHELKINEDGHIVITSERQIQDIISKIKKTDLILAVFRYAADQVYPKILSSENKYYKPHFRLPSGKLRRLIDKASSITKGDVLADENLHFRSHKYLRCSKQEAAINASARLNLMIIDGPAGTGKTKIACKIAIQFSRVGKKVIMGAVTHAASESIANHMLQEIVDQYNYDDEIRLMQLIRNLMIYYQVNSETKEQKDKNHLQTEIRILIRKLTILKQKSNKLNILYFNSLLESNDYFSILLFLRYFTFNSQVLINLIIINKQSSILDLFINLDKIARKQHTVSQFHEQYKAAVRLTMKNADIIITNTSKAPQINDYQRQDEYFLPEVAILDEARQATLIDTYCILSLNVNRLILLGDDEQISTTPNGNFESLNMNPLLIFDQSSQIPRYTLSKQYRMHPEIFQFAQYMTYGNQIQDGVTKNTLAKHQSDFFNNPLFMVTHYASQEYPENPIENGCFNVKQIMIIKLYIDRLQDDEMKNVGIMTFYKAQASRMKLIFADQIKLGLVISTVDGYQGGERDYIFLSAVRSNWKGILGFAQDKHRLNVAFTRARKTLAIVGNINTLQFGVYDNKWKQVAIYLSNKKKIFHLGEDWQLILQQEQFFKRKRDSTKFRQIKILDDDELEDLEKKNPGRMKKLKQKAIVDIEMYEVQELPFVNSRYN